MHHKWKEISDMHANQPWHLIGTRSRRKVPLSWRETLYPTTIHASIKFDCQQNYGDGYIYWLTCIHIQAAATGRKNNITVQLICANKATTPNSCTVVTITELMKNWISVSNLLWSEEAWLEDQKHVLVKILTTLTHGTNLHVDMFTNALET